MKPINNEKKGMVYKGKFPPLNYVLILLWLPVLVGSFIATKIFGKSDTIVSTISICSIAIYFIAGYFIFRYYHKEKN